MDKCKQREGVQFSNVAPTLSVAQSVWINPLKLGFHYGLMWDYLRYLNIFFLSQVIPSGNISQKLSHKIVTH